MMKVVKVNAAGLRVRESRQTKLESIRERERQSQIESQSHKESGRALCTLYYTLRTVAATSTAPSRCAFTIQSNTVYNMHYIH